MNSWKLEQTFLAVGLGVLITVGASMNLAQQKQLSDSKLPADVEQNENYQKWITNHKNKAIPLEGDDFRFVEENEVYNTMRLEVYPVSDSELFAAYKQALEAAKNTKGIRFSPNGESFVDYRHEHRTGLTGKDYEPNNLLFIGRKDERIIENKLLECNTSENCYIDRAYFLDDNRIVASTFSLAPSFIENGKPFFTPCALTEKCPYVVTMYVIDKDSNSANVYVSPSFELVLADKIEGF